MSTESLETLQDVSDNDKLSDEYFAGANDVDTLPTTGSGTTAIGNIVVRPFSPELMEQLPPRNRDVPPRVAIEVGYVEATVTAKTMKQGNQQKE